MREHHRGEGAHVVAPAVRVEREHEVAAEAEAGLARDHRGREHGLLHPQVQHAKVDHEVADPRRGEVCQEDAVALVRQPPTEIGGGGKAMRTWNAEPKVARQRSTIRLAARLL